MQISSNDRSSPIAPAATSTAVSGSPASPAAAGTTRFAQLVSKPTGQAGRPPAPPYEIKRGDTLSGIATDRLKALGRPHGPAEVHKAVAELARKNGIADPDRIYAGQTLRLDLEPEAVAGLPNAALGRSPMPLVASARPVAHVLLTAQQRAGMQLPATSTASAVSGGRRFPTLERTLDRAVEEGYVPATDRGAVRERIMAMADKYRFSPDDFATVALMESNGFNPRATNGRCFGIIQFCSGPQAGAAAVGLAAAPQQILDRPVLEQLDLVDQYFEHNGLQRLPQVGLVDLYLTILTPAAREEKAATAPLPIPGTQARLLYERQDRSQPITRKSILAGLLDHARQMLSAGAAASGNPGGNGSGKVLPLAGETPVRPIRPLG